MKRTFGLWTALVIASASAHAAPTVTTYLEAGADSSAFWDVNNAGTVVGYSLFATGTRAFTWTEGGGFVGLAGPAGATGSIATGVSDGGTIVGSYTTVSGGPQQGFVFDGLSYSTLNIAGATNTWLRAISPDSRYITGYYDAAGVTGQGFVWDTSTATVALIGAGGNDFTIAQGVSDGGVVVGSDLIRDDVSGMTTSRPGFTYDVATGVRTDIDLPGFLRTAFRAIDASGVISGWGVDGVGQTMGFTGYPGAIELISVAGFASTFIEGNNNAGWLVGQVWADDGSARALLVRPSAVPVPGSLALVALALGLLATRRRAAR